MFSEESGACILFAETNDGKIGRLEVGEGGPLRGVHKSLICQASLNFLIP